MTAPSESVDGDGDLAALSSAHGLAPESENGAASSNDPVQVRENRFVARVDAVLDERRDPLEDPEVQRFLAEDPSRLAKLARLQHRLAAVRGLAIRPMTPRPRRAIERWMPVLAAALLVAALGAWFARSPEHSASTVLPKTPIPARFALNTGPSRVLSFEIQLVHATPFERVSVVRDGLRETTRREQLQDPRRTALEFARRESHPGDATATAPEPRPAVQNFVAVVSVGAITR